MATAYVAASHVKKDTGGSGAAFLKSDAPATSTVAGNTLVVFVYMAGNKDISSVTDSAGNTYTELKERHSANYWKPGMWWCPNALSVVSGTGWWQVDISGSADLGLETAEFSGLGSTPTKSADGDQNTGSSSPSFTVATGTGGTGTPSAGDLVLTAVCSDHNSMTFTIDRGTMLPDYAGAANPGMRSAYILSAAGGTETFVWSLTGGNGDGASVVASITPSGGGGGSTTTHFLGLLGVGT